MFLYQNIVIPLINDHIKELIFPISKGTDMTLLLHSKDLTVNFAYHSFVFLCHQETGRKSKVIFMYMYQHSKEKSSVRSNAQITMLKWITEHRQQDFSPQSISVSL